jgi:hypothetical protein
MQQLSLLAEDLPPIQYWPDFLDRVEADQLLQQSLALAWQQNHFPTLGKRIPLPRLELMFGDSVDYSYTYSVP